MGIGPAIASIGTALGQAGTAIGTTAVEAARIGGSLAVSPVTIPLKAAGLGTAANAIGRTAGTAAIGLTGAGTLQSALSPTTTAAQSAQPPITPQAPTTVPTPQTNALTNMVNATSQVGAVNQPAAQSVAGALNSPNTTGVSSADVADVFKKSTASIVLDAIAIPLAASPETLRIFSGVRGMVESIQDSKNIPKALEIIDKVGSKEMAPREALVALGKTGVSLKTMGDIMDTSKGLWELRDAPVASKKKLVELINSTLETPDKITSLIEKAAASNVPATKRIASETLGMQPNEIERAPSLRQQSFLRLFPGATSQDYKEFEAIYSPLVRQKQDPLMAEAMGEIDPWAEAVKQYSTSLGLPNPLGEGTQTNQSFAPATPAQQGFKEGQTATHPVTKQKIIYSGGKWKPLQ